MLALVVAGLAIAVWAPWDSKQREAELEWLRAYAGWSAHSWGTSKEECEATYERELGAPPSKRLRVAADIARETCSAPGDAEHWEDVQWRVRSTLIASHYADAATSEERILASAVHRVHEPLSVSCWPEGDWAPLEEDVGAVDEFEYRLAGLADPPRRRIHLSPAVCEPLSRLFGGSYQPYLNDESLQLAEALLTLAHEAEHVRNPYATEAETESYALQDIRGLVLDRGRSRGYANELALLAWEIGYPQNLPEYQTRKCHDGGPLDRRPDNVVWP